MKTKFCKFIVLAFFFLSFISTVTAQTCALKISDPTASGSYSATITFGYMYGGIPYVVGSQSFFGLVPNDVNNITPLPWGPPIDTDDNIYILRAEVYNGLTHANNFPAYSSWFNSTFYFYNNINIIAYFN
jgi:hypothetical protein